MTLLNRLLCRVRLSLILGAIFTSTIVSGLIAMTIGCSLQDENISLPALHICCWCAIAQLFLCIIIMERSWTYEDNRLRQIQAVFTMGIVDTEDPIEVPALPGLRKCREICLIGFPLICKWYSILMIISWFQGKSTFASIGVAVYGIPFGLMCFLGMFSMFPIVRSIETLSLRNPDGEPVPLMDLNDQPEICRRIDPAV